MNLEDLVGRSEIPEKFRKPIELLINLLNNSSDHIYFKDKDSRFILMSRSQADRFEPKDPSNVIGKTDFDYFSQEHAEQAFRDEQDIMKIGKAVTKEEKETWPNGSETWVSTTKSPLYDKDGKIIGTFGISRDITQQKKLEERAARAETLSAVGTSVSKVSHDFRNKLNSILSIVDLLGRERSIDPDSQTYHLIQTLKSVAEQGICLTNELLDFSKDKKYNLNTTNIEKVIKDSLMLVKLRPDYQKIEITANFDPNTYEVEADVFQINRVLENILNNAKDAMPSGGRLSIEVGNVTIDRDYTKYYPGTQEGDYILISVNDNGIGMSKETLSKIFKEFYTTKGAKGNGLGLAISNIIVKRHAGFIDVYSEQGQGTTFKIYIPRSNKKSTIGQRSSSYATQGTETILVVDDEKSILDTAKIFLEKQGYKVLTAEDGQQALELYRKGGIDLTLLDLTIPEVDSSTVIKEILDINSSAKIVISSGYSHSSIEDNILRKTAGYLPKPFLNNSLCETIRSVLDSKA